jgi:hypothetical protein
VPGLTGAGPGNGKNGKVQYKNKKRGAKAPLTQKEEEKMPIEEKFDAFLTQYAKDKQEDQRKYRHDRHENLAYISIAFLLSIMSLVLQGGMSSFGQWFSIIVVVILFSVGSVNYIISQKYKK